MKHGPTTEFDAGGKVTSEVQYRADKLVEL